MAAVVAFEDIRRRPSEATHPFCEFAGRNRENGIPFRQRLWRYLLEVFVYPTKVVLKVSQGIGHVG